MLKLFVHCASAAVLFEDAVILGAACDALTYSVASPGSTSNYEMPFCTLERTVSGPCVLVLWKQKRVFISVVQFLEAKRVFISVVRFWRQSIYLFKEFNFGSKAYIYFKSSILEAKRVFI